jgi:hypothetical protein
MLASIHNSVVSDCLRDTPESYVSHSLSSLINQRKLQKIQNKGKASTKYHYKRNNKNHNKLHGDFKVSTKRRRSSSYWYNTNINNVVVSNKVSEDPLNDAEFTSVKPESKHISKLFDVTIHNELEDLDFLYEYGISDIQEFVEPVYDIKKHRSKSQNSKLVNIKEYINSLLSTTLTNDQSRHQVELKDLNINRQVKDKTPVPSLKPMKNSNKEIMQPHFMRLYALEQRSRTNGSLPDLDIDENLLSQLTYEDIWTLDVPTESKDKESKNLEELKIKLALLTRKKLWCDMIIQKDKNADVKTKAMAIRFNDTVMANRNDLDYIKLRSLVTSLKDNKFTHIGCNNKETDKVISLVRLNKQDTMPWNKIGCSDIIHGKDMMNEIKITTQLKSIQPFGKLPNSRHTQYLVKGWVDKRFYS